MEDKTQYWYLEKFDLFKKMTKDEIKSVEKSILVRTLKKKTVLHFPKMLNKYLYFLKEGLIKIAVMNKDGKEFIKYLIKPGNLFGEIALLGDVESPDEYAVAVEDSIVCFIDAGKMKQWMNENDDLRTEVFKQIGSRIKKVENRLLSMFFKDADTRVRDFNVEFVKDFGKQTSEGYEAKNFLTHDDIAKLTLTSRQTVSSILNKLRKNGQIEYNNRTIKIPRSSGLFHEDKKPG
jgi:CRP/FNR family cyclic AMP-dependent transcriptional regulator